MKALRLNSWKSEPVLEDVPMPEPGPGQVLVQVGAAGACHSDLHLMNEFEPGTLPWSPPFTLGHENAGWVHTLGDGVTGLEVGQPVSVTPDDTGRVPVVGSLVTLSAEEIAIRRHDPQVGDIVVHFPRAGFVVAAA